MNGIDRNDALVALGAVLTGGALFTLGGVWLVLLGAGLCMMALGAYRSG
ncbi:MAG: hypothetical protein POELPBGB_04074 [Bacteroidia bacterium]|nr:hypothetical protein [Bacteroidia bacterium]